MSIEKRLERLEAILDARGLDWDHPRVEEDHFVDASKMAVEEPPKKWRRLTDEFVQPGDWMNAKGNRQDVDPPDGGWIPADPYYFGRRACTLNLYFARPVSEEPAKEPPKKWRILGPGEEVQEGDLVNCKLNPPSYPPNGDGWIDASICVGSEVAASDECVFARLVTDELSKKPEPEPEHPAGPMPDPGEGYRLLSKNPPEELMPGDELQYINGTWVESDNARTHRRQGLSLWYRRKIETAKPAWEPKVGDWVKVTKPKKQDRGDDPIWLTTMDQHDGKVFQVKELIRLYQWPSVMCDGINCAFKIDWLSPAEPPKPEYREPVLPGDLGKWAEFSQDGINWTRCKLRGCYKESEASLTIWSEKNIGFRHCRIKKDA